MNTYSAVSLNFQSAKGLMLQEYWQGIKAGFSAYREARSQRKTDKLLASLDRSILEDIGIPHYDVSTKAGVLDRYPRILTVKSRPF